MFNTIRWKFLNVLIILVMIATILSGVLVVQFFDEYNIKSVDSRLDSLSSIMLSDLLILDDLDKQSYLVDTIIHNKQFFGFNEEIYVIAKNKIIASSSDNINNNPEDFLDISLLIDGLNSNINSKIVHLYFMNEELKVMDKIYPIKNKDNKQIGELYLRYDLKESIATSKKIKNIIVKTFISVIIITFFVSIIMSKSITDPIKEIAMGAKNMAKGNFKTKLIPKSKDEIGELIEIFNNLSEKLDETITKIYSENSKLDAIVNNIGEAIIVFDSNKNIILKNKEAENMFGSKKIDFTMFESFFKETFLKHTGKKEILEKITINNNIYEVRTKFYKNNNDENVGFIYVFQNITKRENLEKLRREFIANVSHELKTPITSIRAYSETLIDNEMYKDKNGYKFLNVINTEAIRMTDLVNDLLNLSNYDDNKIKLIINECNVYKLIEEVILKVKILADDKNQKIEFISNCNNLNFKLDKKRIEQVLINLMSNSIKYSAENKKIRIKLLNFKTKMIIKIIDEGQGIKNENIDRIFERFYRVDSDRNRKTGGSGLGLAIVKEIINLHNAKIDVYSIYNVGSISVLTFFKI